MKGRLLSVLFLLIFCHTMAIAQSLTAVYPKPGQVLHDAAIEIAWNSHPQAISFTLELNTINDFGSPILQTSLATNTFSYSLPQTGDYYWRVTAQLQDGGSASSPVYAFKHFSPNQITGLVLWLDAADAVVDVNNRVSQWIDKSGMGNHVSQTTQSAQPIRALNALNGHPAITFNGTSQYLDGGNILNIGTNSQAVFIVGKTLKNYSSFFAKSIAGSAINRYSLLWDAGKITYLYQDNLSRSISVTKTIGSYELFSAIASRSNAKNYLFSNGSLLGSNNINASQNFSNNYNFLIGAYNNSSGTTPPLATLFHQGDIEEVIMFFYDITEAQRKTIERHLRKKYFPSQFIAIVNLGLDREAINSFCSFTLNAGLQYSTYQWNTGENTSSISINKSGIYSVTVTDSYGFSSIDSVRVQFPTTQLNSQQEKICSGTSLEPYPITPSPENYTFEWSNGATTREINITEAGSYWVKITDGEGCFAYSDTLNITVDNFPYEFTLGEDLELCSGNILAAPENPDIISWQWGNGAVTPQIPITESGIYGITVTNTNGCIATDEVEVSIIGIAPETDFSADTVCLGSPTSFTDLSTLAEGSIEQWLWDFGDGNSSNEQNPQHTYTLPGSYMVSLTTITSSTCQKSIAKEVIVKAVPTAFFETSTACINVPYQFTDLSTAPEGLEIVSWNWDFGDGNTSDLQNPSFAFAQAGINPVQLQVATGNNCTSTFNENIEIIEDALEPESSSLILPKQNSIHSPGNIVFQSNFTTNAVLYELEISTDEAFSDIIAQQIITPEDSILIDLGTGDYFARINAFNICMDETHSPIIHFSVFEPINIPELSLWLSAGHVVAANGKISQWTDLSGLNHHVSQTTEANQPLIVANVLNEQAVVRFNGSQFLNGGNILNIGTSSRTFIVVGKINSNNATFFSKSALASSPSRYAFLRESSNFLLNYHDNASRNITTTIPSGQFFFSHGISNRDIAQNQFLINNELRGVIAINSSHDMTSEYPFLVGAYANSTGTLPPQSTLYLNGDIAEIIFFDKVLSSEEDLSIRKYLQNKYSPPVNLGADKRIVYGFCPVVLDAGAQFTSYLWNTGETTSSITVNSPGTYTVSVTDIFGFNSSDEVEIRFPDMGLNTMDTTLCQGESMELAFSSAFTSDISLLWNTGETSPSIIVAQAGEYTLTLTDTIGCSTNLTAQIGIDEFENTATLGEDRPFCMGDTLWLQSPWQPWQLDYLWNDGSTGSGLVISQAGEYSLTATNPNGCTGTDTVSLSFQGYAPEVSFSAPPVCFGLPTSFTDGSTVAQSEIISRSWLFNDPQYPAGGASGSTVSHTYSEPGIFIASLEVSSIAGCSSSLSQAVQVYHLPEPAFGPPNVCANLNTPFSDKSTDMEGGIASWQWTATDTDGSTLGTSQLQNPEFSFPNPGTASLKLITTSLVGCSDSISRNINVRYSPEVDFSFTPACLGDMVSFTNLSQAPAWAGIQSTHWDFGDGDTTLLTNPSHLFQEAGIYPVTLTARAINGCQISLSKDVTVNYPPLVAFETPPICAATDYQFIDNTTAPLSEITSWNWNFSGLGSSTEQNPWFSFDLPGQYNISLEAKSAAGCAGTITQPIEVMPRPQADFSFSPSFGVAPLNIGFQNLSQGAASYSWDFGDGSALSTEAEPQHTYTQNGIYNAQLVSVSNMGCSDTLSRQIKVMFSTLDIAVGEIHYRTEQDYLICGVKLINLGTRSIESLQLTVSPQNLSPVMETWSGFLPSGDLLYYEFNARFPISKAMPQYLCMDVAIPTIVTDDIPENNHLCLALDDSFTVLPPYPNPANGNIQLSFILPAEENVTIILIDSHGNLIDNIFDGPAQQGINTLYLNASSLNAGLYAFRILYRDQVVVKKMVIVN